MLRKNDTHLIAEDLSKRYGEIFNIRLFTSNLVFLNSSRLMRKLFASGQYRDVTNDRPWTFYERSLDDDGKLLPSEHILRSQLIPFGVGKRNCVGESFAKSRMFMYVTSLLQSFDFTPGLA
ncbi:cytochrome P450 2D6-like [Patella vulgata]|uniref:cytochrome P450 2D6-like n=1 Tax=Patella vulgata TaxID=6465 RepID=UPI0024A90374|nr:cytochrome P450 2D6-like [Patella vulgata]